MPNLHKNSNFLHEIVHSVVWKQTLLSRFRDSFALQMKESSCIYRRSVVKREREGWSITFNSKTSSNGSCVGTHTTSADTFSNFVFHNQWLANPTLFIWTCPNADKHDMFVVCVLIYMNTSRRNMLAHYFSIQVKNSSANEDKSKFSWNQRTVHSINWIRMSVRSSLVSYNIYRYTCLFV